MKNSTIIKKHLLLIIMCVILTSCGVLKLKPNNCIGTCVDGEKNFIESHHRIKLSKAKKLYDNYNEKIKPAIKTVQQKNIRRDTTRNQDDRLNEYKPTEYVLINIETLKCYLKFLEEVERKNKDARKTNSKITGIAVFFKANNDDELLIEKPDFYGKKAKINYEEGKEKPTSANVPLDEDIRGRLGIFLAPTFRDNSDRYTFEEQRHQPFYIQADAGQSDIYQGTYLPLLDYFSGAAKITEETNMDLKGYGNYENYKSFVKLNQANNNTTLILEEFTQMPPKKPTGTQ